MFRKGQTPIDVTDIAGSSRAYSDGGYTYRYTPGKLLME